VSFIKSTPSYAKTLITATHYSVKGVKLHFRSRINQLFNLERTANKLNQARFKELAYIFGNPEITIIRYSMLIAVLHLCWVLNQNMPP
jgi:hypothetical protein